MAGGYQEFAYEGKQVTTANDLGKGQVALPHLSPAMFLEMQQIKLHKHTGIDSQVLEPEATPFMIRGYKLRERVERATSTWTGSGSSGTIIVSFGTSYFETPTVIASPSGGNVNIQVVVGNITKDGFTLYWKDDTGTTRTSIPIDWIALGR